ncbi:MAG TPA: TonB-dependent receptor, partial [Opitutaceae bacterium]
MLLRFSRATRAAGLAAAVLLHAPFPAAAQTMPTPPAGPGAVSDEPVITLEKFSVEDRITDPTLAIGTDSTRNTISITREALLAAPAGISGLKMLESLPGFNVQTSDALGLYEFGNSVTVRAFNYQQIGFVLDGIPMGRSDQFGGSPIYRYVDNENLGRVTASQGTGDVSQPSYASLGPLVAYSTIAPSAQPGAQIAATVGSNDLERTFIKVQSGQWNGLSGYVSRSKQTSNQWRGPGTFDREHWDAKLRYELSPSATL